MTSRKVERSWLELFEREWEWIWCLLLLRGEAVELLNRNDTAYEPAQRFPVQRLVHLMLADRNRQCRN